MLNAIYIGFRYDLVRIQISFSKLNPICWGLNTPALQYEHSPFQLRVPVQLFLLSLLSRNRFLSVHFSLFISPIFGPRRRVRPPSWALFVDVLSCTLDTVYVTALQVLLKKGQCMADKLYTVMKPMQFKAVRKRRLLTAMLVS